MGDSVVQILRWLLIALSVGVGVVLMSTAEAPRPPVCSRCGAGPHAADANRCARGHMMGGNEVGREHHFPVGNQAAFKHGVRAFETRGPASLPAEHRLSVGEFEAQVRRDRGDDLTAIGSGYVRKLVEIETVSRLLASDLASRGLFTPRGRVRATFSRWLEALDRWDRFAQRIGVDRRARPVTLAQRLAELEPIAADAERGTEEC